MGGMRVRRAVAERPRAAAQDGGPGAQAAAGERPGARVSAGERPGVRVAVSLAIGVVAISTSPILVRLAHLPALALAFWRCLAGAVLLAPFALRARARRPAPARVGAGAPAPALARADRLLLAASGACLALHFALFNASLAFTTVASSTVLVCSSPLFVGLGSARFLGETPSRRTWAGIALATAGAVLVGLGDLGAADLGVRALLGDVMAFAGAVLVSAYILLGRAVRQRLPAATYSSAVYGVAAAVLLPAALATGAPLGGYTAGSWLAVAAVIAGPQLLGHTVFNSLLATVTATVVAVVILTEPVGATILARLLFHELPAPGFWAGAPLVLAGVWLAASSPPAQAAVAEEPPG